MPGIGKLLAEGGQREQGSSFAALPLSSAPPKVRSSTTPSPKADPPAGGDFSLLRLSPDEVMALEGPLQMLQQEFPNLHVSRDRQGAFLLIPARRQQEFLEIASESGFDPSVLKRIETGGKL